MVLLALNNEPECLTSRRKAAWEAYKNKHLPDRVSHLWRYSDPAWFEINDRKISTEKIKSNFCISQEGLNRGIILQSISEAFSSNYNLVVSRFGELVKTYPSKMIDLNDATWSNGYFLYIPRFVKLEEPIVITLPTVNSNQYEAIRILILLEEGASVNLIDEISSSNAGNLLINVVIETFLACGAKLNYLNVQNHDKQTIQHLFHRAILEDNAELTKLIIAVGGKISKTDLGILLNGNGASIATYGIVLGDGIQKFDHHTTIEHLAPHTKSSLDFRVVVKDKATSTYTGNLKITNEAIKSDAHQENRNLLLSNEAKAESIPELEILTNDVIRCNHGVTVGQIDKEQIYYLMSRGFSQEEAERMIVQGFVEPVISKISDSNLKEKIQNKVQEKLGV